MAIWRLCSRLIDRKTALPPLAEGCRGLRGTAGDDRCFIPEMRWLKFELTHDMADCSLSGSTMLREERDSLTLQDACSQSKAMWTVLGFAVTS